MVFRMTGNTTEPSARPLLFQIQGKFRGIPSVEGVPSRIPPPRTSGKLSQSTLYKVFTIMLGSVFIIYCTLMMVMIRYHQESSVVESEGRWGPTLAVSRQVLQDHIQQQVEQKRIQIEADLNERRLRDSVKVMSDTNKDSGLTPTTDKKDIDSLANIKEMDMHEMQPLVEATHQHDPIRNRKPQQPIMFQTMDRMKIQKPRISPTPPNHPDVHFAPSKSRLVPFPVRSVVEPPPSQGNARTKERRSVAKKARTVDSVKPRQTSLSQFPVHLSLTSVMKPSDNSFTMIKSNQSHRLW